MQLSKGSCHCGAIHFSFVSEPVTKGVRCNCSFCSKRGTLLHVASPGSQFQWAAEEGALGLYQFAPPPPPKKAKHYFCRNCGVHRFGETTRRPGCHIVNLGCIEGVDAFALETISFDGKVLL
ncbi:GFA family protein [Janthinobacterium fluminis]|uniref:GFA family protein n=1 Tax=Janthinobacterium fluminis TaxID=2987524 RepID=UPI003B43B3C8